MVVMVPLLTPVGGYYTTVYNHIAMVLTPLRDPGKTMVEPHFILQGFPGFSELTKISSSSSVGLSPQSFMSTIFRNHHELLHNNRLMDDYKKCLFDSVNGESTKSTKSF